MKILSIGNSFSVDAHAYLSTLAKDAGEDITAVNLAIGGCSLKTHWENIESNGKKYLHLINDNGWGDPLVTVDEIIKGEKFDVVTLQQVSHFSGQYETYQPYLNNLIDYVKKHQPEAKLYFHKTWAYEIDSKHSEYPIYDCDQEKMYASICRVSKRVCDETGLSPILSGDVIQAMRTRLPEFDYKNGGMTLCLDDGFHMSRTYGRYAVALTWLATLTKKPVTPTPFNDLDEALCAKICDIVNEIVFK